MFNLSKFLKEQFLVESADTTWGLNRTDAGKMHEVLTGGLINHYASVYQANKKQGHEEAHRVAMDAITNPARSENKKKTKVANIAHMEQFRDENANKSAGEWHDHLSSKLKQSDYDNHLAHATHAATNIINHLHEQGVTDIRRTHFTANAKDIGRLTNGKDSSEQGNNSDIVIEHGHKNEGGGFFGVSLKSGKEKKAFSPGLDKISKKLDEYYEKITQKKGSFSADTQAASDAAQEDHHKIINKHASVLKSILGKSGISDTSEGSRITESGLKAARYAQELLDGEVKPTDAKGNANPDHVRKKKALSKYTARQQQQLATVYRDLRASRLKHHKRAVTQSFTRHMNEILSGKHDKKPGVKQLRGELIGVLTNTSSRPSGSMRIMRHNTIYNQRTNSRTSEIGYGLGDTAKETQSYDIKSGDGINFTIRGYRGDGSQTLHIQGHSDSSPSEGSGVGTRKTVQFSLKNVKDSEKKKAGKRKLNEMLLEAKANKAAAAFERMQSSSAVAQKNKQIQQSRENVDSASKSQFYNRKSRDANRASQATQRHSKEGQTQTFWRDEDGIPHVGGADFAVNMAKAINLSDRSPNLSEEAPANAMGTVGISGAQTAVNAGIAGYDLPIGMVRRKPPKMFAGKAVFTVPSSDFYNATLGRKKGKHYRSYVKGELGEEVRQYALENKNAPIILEDETTGAMMYLKYGKEK